MKSKIVLSAFVVYLYMCRIPGTDAKQRALKIVIPSKIRYVHHHHTHVVLMKDKKPYRERTPDAKIHHLHYYEDGRKKNKGVNHHYYIPILPQPPEDEAEDESVTKYTIAHPNNNRVFQKPDFISTRQLPPPYEEQPYTDFPGKFHFYDRNSKTAYVPQRSVMEYYETDPYFPVLVHDRSTAANDNMRYELKEDIIPHYTGGHDFDSGQLFYAEKPFYESRQKYSNIY